MNHPLRDLARFGNAAHLLLETAVAAPDRPAIVDGGRPLDYATLAGRAGAIAAALVRAGVESGDRVAMFLRRGTDAAAAYFGALSCGAIAVVVNESLRPRQVEHVLHHAGAKVLLASTELTSRLPRPLQTDALLLDVAAIPATGDAFQPLPRVGSDPAQILYTSGSTGLPKGVTLSHANLWAGTVAVTHYVGITAADRIASLLPFSFDYGLNQLLCCVATGATLVVERSPVPQRIVGTLRREAVTVLPAVPPLWLQLLGVEAFRTEPLPALRAMTNTGGRVPTEAVRSLRRGQPAADLFLMYGLTEAFRSAYLSPDRVDRKPNSFGQAIPGAELLVVNEDRQPCRPGEVGELVHRGPTVALGYWNDQEATARRFSPHPLRPPGTPDAERVVFSGDLVYADEEGDLFFVGRRDAMIKTLGYRVSPDEVVDALYASGEVLEAVVTSEPEEARGSVIVAYVVLAADGTLDRLQGFAARELPRYMQPSRYEVRSTLPRTSSGKHDAAAAAGLAP